MIPLLLERGFASLKIILKGEEKLFCFDSVNFVEIKISYPADLQTIHNHLGESFAKNNKLLVLLEKFPVCGMAPEALCTNKGTNGSDHWPVHVGGMC
jgi:hypothetical protein